jgi:hypothetical protein
MMLANDTSIFTGFSGLVILVIVLWFFFGRHR